MLSINLSQTTIIWIIVVVLIMNVILTVYCFVGILAFKITFKSLITFRNATLRWIERQNKRLGYKPEDQEPNEKQ